MAAAGRFLFVVVVFYGGRGLWWLHMRGEVSMEISLLADSVFKDVWAGSVAKSIHGNFLWKQILF